jgi:hypothetical protein
VKKRESEETKKKRRRNEEETKKKRRRNEETKKKRMISITNEGGPWDNEILPLIAGLDLDLLDLRDCHNLNSPEEFTILFRKCHNLSHLAIRSFNITDELIQIILENCYSMCL